MALPLANVVSDALSGNNIITQELAELGILPPQWGIFESSSSSPVIIADSVLAFEFKKDWVVADYPLEEGAFESYDKVETPFDARFTFFSGGSLANRQQLIDSIESIAGDMNLYDIVTPEKTYPNCNIQHYDYRRVHGAAGLIQITVWVIQIRETAEGELATASPNGAQTTNTGQVQTSDPSPQQESVLSSWKTSLLNSFHSIGSAAP